MVAGQDGYSLEVMVDGASPNEGQITLSLFEGSESFLKAPAVKLTAPVDGTGSAAFVMDDLAPGDYALSAVYDRDSNGRLNTGLFGIPSEPVGFSNNTRGLFGPPKFDDASFPIDGNTRVTIELRNARD